MAQKKRDTLVLHVGGWAWGVTTPPGKRTCVQETSELPRMGLTNRRRGWRRRAENRDEWRRLVREAKGQKGL